jgi:hypothetical protein
MTSYQMTTTIPLVGVSGFTRIMCIRSLELRYADSRPPIFSLHLSSTDSWVAHRLRLCHDIAYRDFGISNVASSCHFQIAKPETLTQGMINGSDSYLTNGCDHFAKSHFAISESLMYCVLDIMKSRSPIPDIPCRDSTVLC